MWTGYEPESDLYITTITPHIRIWIRISLKCYFQLLQNSVHTGTANFIYTRLCKSPKNCNSWLWWHHFYCPHGKNIVTLNPKSKSRRMEWKSSVSSIFSLYKKTRKPISKSSCYFEEWAPRNQNNLRHIVKTEQNVFLLKRQNTL